MMLAAVVSVVLSTAVTQTGGAAPPAERVARLARGVNLSHWIWYPRGRTAEERRAFFSAADASLLLAAGFTHVRLPFEPGTVWDENAHALRPDGITELRACAGVVLAGGLAVIIDAHPNQAAWVKPDESGRFAEFERFWAALAAELSTTDPERVFLEILNEPHDLPKNVDGALVWPAAQVELVRAVRAAAPRHTLIVTGDEWGGIDGLLKLMPIADANVVYSFHFYDPMVFTHQGATWGWEPWKHMKDVPYPAAPENVARVVGAIADKSAAEAVRRYGAERWGEAKVQERIGRAAAWAKEHHVVLYCGEFGVHRPLSPRESRLTWLGDVRGALEHIGAGWAMWDYAGGFALVDGGPGTRVLDGGVVEALGLPKIDPATPEPGR